MTIDRSRRFASSLVALLGVALLAVTGALAHAQPAAQPAPPAPGAPPAAQDAASAAASAAAAIASDALRSAAGDESARQEGSDRHERSGRRRHRNDVVSIGRDSDLPAGERADSVVSILGSSTSAGEARDVVSILGTTRVSGPVQESAVAILGNTIVDSAIHGDAVAVLGNVELGPHADVEGDVVAVGGKVLRDPSAVIHGDVRSVGAAAPGFGWLRPWIDHCLFYGRPLALVSGIGWAWVLALAFLALYACLALLFRQAVEECVRTVDTQPGLTALAALLTLLLTPLLVTLLFVTLIGIAAVPFIVAALFCAGIFGKAVMLAWLGRRVMGARSVGPLGHPATAVLVGGAIVLALYLVPFIGFVVYKVLDLFGLGAVAYTLVRSAQDWRAARRDAAAPAPATAAATAPAPATATAPATAAAAAAAPATAPAATPAAPSATPTPAASAAPPAEGAAPAADGSAAAAPPPATPATPAVSAALPRAGFWIRMAALLLDALLVGFVTHILHSSHLELLLLAVYGAVMWKLRGSTIGGTVFDLQVVRLDGRPIDWETAIVRALGCFLSLAVGGLGFFWIAFDHGKQAWHDKIAGTAVVRAPKGVPLV